MDQNTDGKSRPEPLAERSLYPLERSTKLQSCALYWVPVFSQPFAWKEQQWFMALFDRLHVFLADKHRLRQEAFLQMKLIAPLGEPKDLFHRHQMELMPRMGLSRKPGAALPKIPTEEDLAPVMKGKQKFVFNDYIGDYCFWFLTRKEQWRRNLFLGHGAYTMLYMPHDPKTTPPPVPDYPAFRANPVFAKFDVDALWETTHLLSDRFGPASKAVFGRGLEEDPSFAGLPFVIPRVNSRDLHNLEPNEMEEWFTIFDVLIQESPDDNGVLIASRHDLDEPLGQILEAMRSDRIDHPRLPSVPAS